MLYVLLRLPRGWGTPTLKGRGSSSDPWALTSKRQAWLKLAGYHGKVTSVYRMCSLRGRANEILSYPFAIYQLQINLRSEFLKLTFRSLAPSLVTITIYWQPLEPKQLPFSVDPRNFCPLLCKTIEILPSKLSVSGANKTKKAGNKRYYQGERGGAVFFPSLATFFFSRSFTLPSPPLTKNLEELLHRIK